MVYLDSCIAIYLIEEHPLYLPSIEHNLMADVDVCVSDLVVLECLVKPLKQQNVGLIAKFKNEFEGFVNLPINPAIYLAAAQLRADHGLKTPDALHLACAIHHGCTEFWTNDDRLSRAAASNNLRLVNLTQTT
jgi:uncharacterized protein